jgi:hypothetical protein
MKKRSKIAIAATASLVGALAFALPSMAHDNSQGNQTKASAGKHSPIKHGAQTKLSSTITGIPETVTDLKDAVRGAHYEIFLLDAAATTLPDTKPTTGARHIGIRPNHPLDSTAVVPEIVNGEITSDIGFRAPKEEGVSRFALYPTDGSAAILVTVTTDAAGVSTAVSSSPITVSYDATVAAEAKAHQDEAGEGKKMGKGSKGKGHQERSRQHSESSD